MRNKEKMPLEKIVEIIWLNINGFSYSKIRKQLNTSVMVAHRKVKKYSLTKEEIEKFKKDKNLLIENIKSRYDPILDLKDQKFGNLTPKYIIKGKHQETCWFCECDCGKTNIVRWEYLVDGRVKSCGCLRKIITTKRTQKDPIKVNQHHVYLQYILAAKKRNLNFDLTKEQCVNYFDKNCYYCGIEPFTKIKKHLNKTNCEERNIYYSYNGIDRIDNSKGYSLDNCVTCCKFCNFIKGSKDQSFIYEWLNKVKEKMIKDFILKGGYANGKPLQENVDKQKINSANESNSGP